MPIHLEFTLTFEDYLNAVRLHARKTWWSQCILLFQEFVAPILGIMIGTYAVLQAVHGALGVPFIVMVGCALYMVAGTNPRSRMRWTYNQTEAGKGSEALDLDELQIVSQGLTWRYEFRWAAFCSFSEDRKTLLLHLAPGKSIIVPKRVCTVHQLEALRNLLTKKMNRERDGSST
jgi:hypothetical protein